MGGEHSPDDDADGDDADAADDAAADDDVPVVPIEDAIDLHGFQPRDIPSVVEEYVRAAAEKGFREVRLIHGRGTGFQRQRVREVLAGCPEVERFSDAPPTRGGWGATVVWLRSAPR
jgi:dsDNA-specific endonuclease/ATPase MutS2